MCSEEVVDVFDQTLDHLLSQLPPPPQTAKDLRKNIIQGVQNFEIGNKLIV